MASIRVHSDIYELLAARAALERRSVASLATVLLREGLSERGDEREGGLRVAVDPSPRSESRPVTAGRAKPDPKCRNADYHWKLQPGEECKFCGGTL